MTPPGFHPHAGGDYPAAANTEREVLVIFRNGRRAQPRKPSFWTWCWLRGGPHDHDIVYWKYA